MESTWKRRPGLVGRNDLADRRIGHLKSIGWLNSSTDMKSWLNSSTSKTSHRISMKGARGLNRILRFLEGSTNLSMKVKKTKIPVEFEALRASLTKTRVGREACFCCLRPFHKYEAHGGLYAKCVTKGCAANQERSDRNLSVSQAMSHSKGCMPWAARNIRAESMTAKEALGLSSDLDELISGFGFGGQE